MLSWIFVKMFNFFEGFFFFICEAKKKKECHIINLCKKEVNCELNKIYIFVKTYLLLI